MRRAVYTIGEKKGRGFEDMHPEEWILKYPRQIIKQEVQKELAQAKGTCIWTFTYLPSIEEVGKEVEIISEHLSENEMEVTEQTEENDWTEVSHKSAARRNNTNKTNKTDRSHTENAKKKNTVYRNPADNNQIKKGKKICSFWITDKCKFGSKCTMNIL